jgi:pimeloyl-ACP methyl ester carboxylesterase
MAGRGPIDLHIDVSGKAAGLEGDLQQAITVHLPDPVTMLDPPMVMFGFPGGGVARGYWCLETRDSTEWSQARYHADRGVVYVSVDHLGVGESTTGDADDFTMEVVTAGNCATVREVLERLSKGTLVDDFPTVVDPVKIGMGQSMGGHFIIQMQGQQALFDAVAVLGYSCIHTVVPRPPDQDQLPPPSIARNSSPETLGVWAERMAAAAAQSTGSARGNYLRAMSYLSFFDESDADSLKEEFVTLATSATTPGAAKHVMSRGVVAEEAMRIECPVFLGFGERDTSQHPKDEPAGYLRSNDIQLAIIPGMAHGQNFNNKRAELWKRIHPWAMWVHGQRAHAG